MIRTFDRLQAPPVPSGPANGEAPVASPAGPRQVVRWAADHRAVLAVALPVVVGLVRLLVALPRPFLSGGDVAFIELAVRRALRGEELLGPYSRFGWHHPGPAMFYLFAPAYALSGGRSRALFLDAWLFNGACAVAAVMVVRHRLGERAARVAAVVIGLLLALVGFRELIDPWNPSLLGVPLVLLLVLSAGAATGSRWSLVGALLVGSFLVQTHLGLLPIVAVVLIAAVAGLVPRLRRRGRPGRARLGLGGPAVVGAVLLSAMWAGPVSEQVRENPGNIERIVAFFRHPPAGAVRSHSWRESLAAVSNSATAPLWGPPPDDRLHPERVALVAGIVAGGALVALTTWRRDRFLAFLGSASMLVLLAALAATTRVIGPLAAYLFTWTPALLVPGAIAGAIAASRAAHRAMPAVARPAGVAALVTASVVATGGSVHAGTTSYGDSPDAVVAARQIEQVVGDPAQVFRIWIVDGQFQVASMLLQLDLDGYRYRVDPPYGLYWGNTDRPPATATPVIVVGTEATSGPAGATELPPAGPIVLWTLTP